MEEINELQKTYKLLGSYSLTSNNHKMNNIKDLPQIKRMSVYREQIIDSKNFHSQHNFTINGQRVFFFLNTKLINRRPIKVIRNFKFIKQQISKAVKIIQYDSSSILLKLGKSYIILDISSLQYQITNLEKSYESDFVHFNGLQVQVDQQANLKFQRQNNGEYTLIHKIPKYETQYVGHQSNFYQKPVLEIKDSQLFLGCASGIYIYDIHFKLIEIVELSRLITQLIIFDNYIVAQIHNCPKQLSIWKKSIPQNNELRNLDVQNYGMNAIDLLNLSATGQFIVFTTSESVTCLKDGQVHYIRNLYDDDPTYIAADISNNDNYLAISTPQYLVFVNLITKQDQINEFKKSFKEYDRIKVGFSMDNQYCAVYSETSRLILYSPDPLKDVIYIDNHHICQVVFGIDTIIIQDSSSISIYDFKGCLIKSSIFNDLYGFFISTSVTMIEGIIFCRNRSDQIVQIRATDLEIIRQDQQPSHIQSCEPIIFVNNEIMMSIGVGLFVNVHSIKDYSFKFTIKDSQQTRQVLASADGKKIVTLSNYGNLKVFKNDL